MTTKELITNLVNCDQEAETTLFINGRKKKITRVLPSTKAGEPNILIISP